MKKSHLLGTVCAAVFGALLNPTNSLAASFTGIGLLPGHTFSEALGVSGNGEVVVGFGIGPSDFTAVTWTQKHPVPWLLGDARVESAREGDTVGHRRGLCMQPGRARRRDFERRFPGAYRKFKDIF